MAIKFVISESHKNAFKQIEFVLSLFISHGWMLISFVGLEEDEWNKKQLSTQRVARGYHKTEYFNSIMGMMGIEGEQIYLVVEWLLAL